MSSGEGLCYECTSDAYLSASIRQTGTRLPCVGCGKGKRKCIPIEDLSAALREVLEKHYQRCEEMEVGDDLNWIVQEIAGLDGPELANRILEHVLPDEGETFATIKDGGDVFLEDAAAYERRPTYAGEFRYTWDSFCFNAKHSARFFSNTAEARLNEIFDGIERFKTTDGKSCIRTIAPSDSESTVYRARNAIGASAITEVLDRPAIGMGPPPGPIAPAGRMNPRGVAVFYGAFDAATCLAEIRLPVGGTAFTVAFRLVRPIKVLDLTVLDQGIHGVSMLDPLFDHVSEQSAFLEGFHDEISRPVLEHEEELEFIPPQVVAEYLAQRLKPPLDGVIYKSPQTGGDSLNIALLHRASGIKGSPSVTISANVAEIGIGDGELVVRNARKPHAPAPEEKSSARFDVLPVDVELGLSDPSKHPDVAVEPTLEVVEGSLKFWKVQSTNQKVESLTIFDLRREHEEDEEGESIETTDF